MHTPSPKWKNSSFDSYPSALPTKPCRLTPQITAVFSFQSLAIPPLQLLRPRPWNYPCLESTSKSYKTHPEPDHSLPPSDRHSHPSCLCSCLVVITSSSVSWLLPLSNTLKSMFNTAARVIPLKQARSCHSSAQNPFMVLHLAQSNSHSPRPTLKALRDMPCAPTDLDC